MKGRAKKHPGTARLRSAIDGITALESAFVMLVDALAKNHPITTRDLARALRRHLTKSTALTPGAREKLEQLSRDIWALSRGDAH